MCSLTFASELQETKTRLLDEKLKFQRTAAVEIQRLETLAAREAQECLEGHTDDVRTKNRELRRELVSVFALNKVGGGGTKLVVGFRFLCCGWVRFQSLNPSTSQRPWLLCFSCPNPLSATTGTRDGPAAAEPRAAADGGPEPGHCDAADAKTGRHLCPVDKIARNLFQRRSLGWSPPCF